MNNMDILKIAQILTSIATLILVVIAIALILPVYNTPEPIPFNHSYDSGVWTPTSTSTPVPTGYYASEPHAGLVGDDMFETMKNWNWKDDYELNGWDCSQMAACMEWALECAGHNAVIMMTESHAWIMVEIEDEDTWYAYECTTCCWIDPYVEDQDHYTTGERFESIHDVYEFGLKYNDPDGWFLEEFGWWVE